MVEVELVEPDGPESPDGPRSPKSPHRSAGPDRPDVLGLPRTPRRRWARGRWLLAGAAVAVVAVAGGVRWDAASVEADDARVAAHGELPGFARSLREPLEERWRTAGVMGATEDLVLVEEGETRDRRVVALDAASGEQRWVLTDPAAAQGGLWCPEGLPERDLLLCWVPGDAVGGPNTDLVLEGMRPERLVAVTTADGVVVGERDLPPQTVGWAALEADVVVAYRDGDALRFERVDPVTGAVRWAVSPPVQLPGAVVSELALNVSDGFVVLTGPVNVVLGGDGTVLGTWATPGATARVETSSIGFAVWTSLDEGTWYDAAGAPGALLVGGPFGEAWARPLDDGDHPGLVIVERSGGLQVVDVREEGPLWERAPVDRVLLRVDGHLVVRAADEVLGLDLRTGEERWKVTLDVVADPTAVVSDGVRILLPRYSAAAGRGLTAYDVADGSPLWTGPVPEGTSVLGVLPGGGVVTYGFADLVVLD